jgi:hypothetical protein
MNPVQFSIGAERQEIYEGLALQENKHPNESLSNLQGGKLI